MSLTFERPKPPRDWSVWALYTSLIVSAVMITATLAWQTGKQLRVSSYLKEHGVTTCQELQRPYGPQGPVPNAQAKQPCAQLVERRHAQCVEETKPMQQELRERRHAYVMCLMAEQAGSAAAMRVASP